MIKGCNTNVIVVGKEDAGKTSPTRYTRELGSPGRKWQQKAGRFELEITHCALSHRMARSQDIEYWKPAKSVARS